MVPLKRLFKAYTESRAFHALVNMSGFIDPTTSLTKSGDLVTVLSVRGPDAESREPQQLDGIAARLTSAMSVLRENFVASSYWIKRSSPAIENETYDDPVVNTMARKRREYVTNERGRKFSSEIYLGITRKANRQTPRLGDWFARLLRNPQAAARESLSTSARMAALSIALEHAKAELHRVVNSFIEQVPEDLDVRVLDRRESFAFLRRLLNPDREKADAVSLKHDIHVDYFAVDSELSCYRNHLRLGNSFIKVLTLKEPPAHTFAHILRDLCRVEAEMVVVTEWNPWEQAKAVGKIRSKRRHFHNTKTGFRVSSERPYEREIMFDDSKEALAGDLGRCMEEMEMKGLQIGEFSWTVIVYGESLEAIERAAAEVARVVGAHEGVVHEETFNCLNSFLATLPGGYPFNLRKLLITNRNHIDMGLWFLPSEGERRNKFLGAPCLAAFETEDQGLYHFNLHVEDVAHTLILGPTGTGKSFLLNFLITHAQKYRPYTFILDIGGSYRFLTEALHGSCVSMRPEELPFSINPFALEPTPGNREFQFGFPKLLVELSGNRMDDTDDKALFEAVQALQVLDPDQRCLSTLANMVPRSISKHLKRWTRGEQYGAWFDNVADTVSCARFQYFDFEGMERVGLPFQPLLFYVLHRFNEIISAPELATVFKLAIVDEAWLFFTHSVTRAYIATALRTWRKKNAAMVLATQSLSDLDGAEILRPVVDNCPTKLLLANPTLDAAFYAEVLRLNETEQDKVRRLISKRQFLLKREGLSKTLNLNVDPWSYGLFTTNPYEAKRRQEAMAQGGGLEAALDILAGGSR